METTRSVAVYTKNISLNLNLNQYDLSSNLVFELLMNMAAGML